MLMAKGLALDGGGVFGVAQAEILCKLTDPMKFDFVAGTSIGSVTAALVALGDATVLKTLPAFFL